MSESLDPSLGKRVSTHLGTGWLWQAFRGRIAIVLDDLPARVIFLEGPDRDVHPLPDDGSVAPWRRPRPKKSRKGFQPASFFGLED